MPNTIFFSWQADTPTREGRNLVERSLERAVSRIGQDTDLEEAIRDLAVDKDTQGVAGSPPIVETIFQKIDEAAVFVPDLTFVSTRLDGRPSPNPNVLVEYGWALKSLGHSRIVPVMNTAFGEPAAETMPFDMAHLRRPIPYNCPAEATEDTRRKQRESLASALESAIRLVLESEDFKSSQPKPAEPPPFRPREPMDGAGRFRPRGEPLGIDDGGFEHSEVKLSDGAAVWLRVMPLYDLGRNWRIAELRTAATHDGYIMPLGRGYGGYGHIRAHDGFGVFRASSKEHETQDAVFLFDTGEIWAINSYLLPATASENAIYFVEDEFRQALEKYAECLTKLAIPPNFKWIAGMEKIKGRGLYVPVQPGHMRMRPGPLGICLVDEIIEEGTYTLGESTNESLRSFFTKIFESCGLDRPAWLDEEK